MNFSSFCCMYMSWFSIFTYCLTPCLLWYLKIFGEDKCQFISIFLLLCCRLGHDAKPHLTDFLKKNVTIVGISDCRMQVVEDCLSNNTGGIRIRLQGFQNSGGSDSLLLLPPWIIIGCSGDKGIASSTESVLKDDKKAPYLSSASLANFASGNVLMLMRSPPHWRYIALSARVENCGPSITTTHFPVNSSTPRSPFFKTSATLGASHFTRPLLNGSPKPACATMEVSEKKLAGRIPFVLSMIWLGRTNDPGAISSRRDPTAEKARTMRTPRDLSAAMLAREGISEGWKIWPIPCLAMKATRVPDAREEITIGADG